jgi:hypothetical protein
MFYKDDWYAWSYDGVKLCHKPNLTAKFDVHLKQTIHTPVDDYYTELFRHATEIRDTIEGKFDLLFSGGIDSEIILRVYKDLGVPLNVYIFKYENNLNYKEYNQAIKVCDALNVPYKSIDFNLQKFFENDAYDIWTKCYASSSGWLPGMKMSEYLDNIPIMGETVPEWRKKEDGTWAFMLKERTKFWTMYQIAIGRKALTDWYGYTPKLILSHMELPRIDNLINNRIPGKLSTVSHKCIIHKDYWEDIDIRQKMTGFEGDMEPSLTSKPAYMIDFDNKYLKGQSPNPMFYYSKEEIKSLLCSY